MTDEKKDEPKEDLISAVERMEMANKQRLEILEREEKLAARKLLGGDSPVAQPPAPVVEKSAREYAEDMMKGKVTFNK